MRRPVHRILFGAATGGSAVILAALALATAIEVAHAQTRPGRGGGAAGVALQQAFPGIDQTGNAHISGDLGFNVSCLGAFCGGGYIGPTGQGLAFYPSAFNSNQASTSGNPIFPFYAPQGANFMAGFNWSRGNSRARVQLELSGCSSTFPCLMTSAGNGENTPLYLSGSNGAAGSRKVVVTTGGINVTAGNLLEIENGTTPTTKAAIDFSGAATFAGATLTTPLTQSSGGTGAGGLTCPAGQFLTSNGTSYSCAAPGAAFVISASVSSAAAVLNQSPPSSSFAISVSHPSLGHFTVTVPGMTVSAIIDCTAIEVANTSMNCSVTPATGQFTVSIVNGANAYVDNRFSFVVVAL